MNHPDPLQPHSHEPNPQPPSADANFTLIAPDGTRHTIAPPLLRALPRVVVPGCYIVSTGHGTSGPFAFGGVRLWDLINHFVTEEWEQAAVISADGFGNRVWRAELEDEHKRPILLADEIDGKPMGRDLGLVRLIVPGERDDALRQIKWVGKITLKR